MIDLENIRKVIKSGLEQYLGVPVIRSNTTAPLPKYPFVSYTIRQLLDDNKGTWGEYSDGKDRIPTSQIWSITVQSDDNSESTEIAAKAHDFFARIGVQYLKDNLVVVQSVEPVTNRDTLLTVDYEYRNGFDVTFGLMNVIEGMAEIIGIIETVQTQNGKIITPQDKDALIKELQTKLDKANADLTNTKAVLSSTQEELSSTQDELSSTKEELSGTKAELQNTKSELSVTKTELSATKAELQSTETELSNTKAELSNTQSELSSTKTELSNTQAELSATKTELATTKEQLQSTETELSNTQAELSNTQSELQNKIIELENTRAELSAVNDELTTTKAELSTTQAELQSANAQLEEISTKLDEIITIQNELIGGTA